MRRMLLLLPIVIALAGCEFPRDPEGNLNRVTGGVMHVGVSQSEPWVRTEAGKEPGGVEVERAGARSVGRSPVLRLRDRRRAAGGRRR